MVAYSDWSIRARCVRTKLERRLPGMTWSNEDLQILEMLNRIFNVKGGN